MKPKDVEKKLREKFIQNLKSQNKIDNYNVTLKPMYLDFDDLDTLIENHRETINPHTISIFKDKNRSPNK